MIHILSDILELAINKRLFKSLKAVRYQGKKYPLVMYTGHGSSENYKTTYTIKKDGDYLEIESHEVEEFFSGYTLVDADSLEGILSQVTFDEKHLKEWSHDKNSMDY